MKKILTTVALLTLGLSFGQTSQFSNSTIEKFANAYTEVRNENMTLQLNMITAIEEAGLTNDEFTKIHMRLKDTETKDQISDEQKRKYKIALVNIEKLNNSIQESIENIIIENGLKVETYHSIAKASQNDQKLKNKIQQYFK